MGQGQPKRPQNGRARICPTHPVCLRYEANERQFTERGKGCVQGVRTEERAAGLRGKNGGVNLCVKFPKSVRKYL